jgi:hypothetical protein
MWISRIRAAPLLASVAGMARFLVERYLSCATTDELTAETRRHRDAATASAARGRPIRCVRSIYLPEDETCLTVFEAPERADLVEALEAADLDVLRVGSAVEFDETPGDQAALTQMRQTTSVQPETIITSP